MHGYFIILVIFVKLILLNLKIKPQNHTMVKSWSCLYPTSLLAFVVWTVQDKACFTQQGFVVVNSVVQLVTSTTIPGFHCVCVCLYECNSSICTDRSTVNNVQR